MRQDVRTHGKNYKNVNGAGIGLCQKIDFKIAVTNHAGRLIVVKTWLILYRGQLVTKKLTQSGAESMAYRLIKEKTWDADSIEVRQIDVKVESQEVK